MPLVRKRRAPAAAEEENDMPRTTHSAARRRASAQQLAEAEEEAGEEDEDDDPVADEDTVGNDDGEFEVGSAQQQMVKNLVRLALASEHSRTPLRRADMTAKALGSQPRQFKKVFAEAQLALRSTFGMELEELPAREKTSISQRRKAASQAPQSHNSNKSWMLKSVLPAQYHDAGILPASRAPNDEVESAYTGLYTLTVALIALYGGRLPEARLERALTRMNAAENTPVDRTDRLLERMAKNGYIVKIKDTSGGEESIEYAVGPRGKVEVGSDGVAGLVRKVYGHSDDGSDAAKDLDRRLERSLKMAGIDAAEADGAGAATQTNGAAPAKRRGRPPRAAQRRPDSDDDEDDE